MTDLVFVMYNLK